MANNEVLNPQKESVTNEIDTPELKSLNQIDQTRGVMWSTPFGQSLKSVIQQSDRYGFGELKFRTGRAAAILKLRELGYSQVEIDKLVKMDLFKNLAKGVYKMTSQHLVISGLFLAHFNRTGNSTISFETISWLVEGTELEDYLGDNPKLKKYRGASFGVFRSDSPWLQLPMDHVQNRVHKDIEPVETNHESPLLNFYRNDPVVYPNLKEIFDSSKTEIGVHTAAHIAREIKMITPVSNSEKNMGRRNPNEYIGKQKISVLKEAQSLTLERLTEIAQNMPNNSDTLSLIKAEMSPNMVRLLLRLSEAQNLKFRDSERILDELDNSSYIRVINEMIALMKKYPKIKNMYHMKQAVDKRIERLFPKATYFSHVEED